MPQLRETEDGENDGENNRPPPPPLMSPEVKKEADNLRIQGARELFAEVIEKGLCIGCGACLELCPYFRSHKGRTARLFPCDLERGRCHAYCPQTNVDAEALSRSLRGEPYRDQPLGAYIDAMAARAGTKAPNGAFQDGGTVTALVSLALGTGLIEAAVLTGRDGLEPRERLVTKAGEVAACASSKYSAAPTLAALNRGRSQGYTRLGVVATPCQATAVAKMRANPMADADFSDPVGLVIGLFCTWALDTRALMTLLEGRVEAARYTAMTIPPPPAGVLIVHAEDGDLELPLEEVRELIPAACAICRDMTAEWADLSVGALEGRRGWNTLIVRSPVGAELVERATAGGYLETEALPAESLDHLSRAAAGKKRAAVGRHKEDG